MNNFDKSSSGVNLELDISYDGDLSQIWFDGAFHVLQYSGRSQPSILIFNQYGNFNVSDFELNDLDNFKIEELTVKQIFKAYYNSLYTTNIDHDLDCKDFSNIKDLLLNLEISLKDTDHKSLLEAIETDLYCDDSYNEFLVNNFTKNYIEIESTGYNQGDHSIVIIPDIVIKSYKDQTVEQITDLLSDEIDRLIWDAPIYARLTIDNKDLDQFDFMEFTESSYNYDREDFLDIAKENIKHDKKDTIIHWLEENLPNQLDYK